MNVFDITIDQSLKDRMQGKAYFLRGFILWRFVILYGGVQLILAAELFPIYYGPDDLGRAQRGAVNGLLAK